MPLGKMEQIEQQPRTMRTPEYREVIDRIDSVTLMLCDLSPVFRVTLVKQLPIALLEELPPSPERGRLVVKHEGLMSGDGRVTVPIDSAHEVVLFIVPGTVLGIERAKLTENDVLHQHAETNGRRHHLVTR